MEPLLRLAHMYELQPVTYACAAFLMQRITKDSYTRLPEAQLRRLRHWLEVALELGLSWLRTAVLECLQDCTHKAVKPAAACSRDCTELSRFQQVWGKVPSSSLFDDLDLDDEPLAAALSSMQAGELRPLLEDLLQPAFNKAV